MALCMMASRWLLVALCALASGRISSASASSSSAPLPDPKVAGSESNGVRIFNTIHAALRQWGSSVDHNGMSFFPITIPAGNLFYHGRHDSQRPKTLEWLAFEIEHASQFAQNMEFLPPDLERPKMAESDLPSPWSFHGMLDKFNIVDAWGDQPQEQAVLADDDEPEKPPMPRWPWGRGYLHTYQAARPLKLVLIDGMSAAKCPLGSMDSQDYILLDFPVDEGDSVPMMRELDRARDLCKLGKEWGVDGWIRMEAGFEIIYCDFSEGGGLDLVEARGTPWKNESGGVAEWASMGGFEWMRAAAARYHGLPRGRAVIDFSAMVSAFSYPLNTTNPDASRPELPRIINTTTEERLGLRARLGEVFGSRHARAGNTAVPIDWQHIVDYIVTRYSDRLWYLAEAVADAEHLRSELATLLYPFLNFPEDKEDDTQAGMHTYCNLTQPIERCSNHFLQEALARESEWTPEDRAIHAAVSGVSRTICTSLFAMREVAASSNGTVAGNHDSAARIHQMAVHLQKRLAWSTWKECGRCPSPDQICYIAMFPAGAPEDHFSPRCKVRADIGMGYFFDGRRHFPPDRPGDEVPTRPPQLAEDL
jgi:hypothetical protein